MNYYITGKFVCLNKWECANQIGSITLHHSRDGAPSLLIAQPGGTFMRIVCQPEEIITQSLGAAEESIDVSRYILTFNKLSFLVHCRYIINFKPGIHSLYIKVIMYHDLITQ